MSDNPKFLDATHNQRKGDLATMQAFKGGKKTVVPLLSKWERETPAGYLARQKNATLYNQTKKTINTSTSMVFRKDVTYAELEPSFEAVLENIDGQHTSLNEFSKDLFKTALWDGVAFILVDMPKYEGEVTSLGEQLRLGIIPYFTKITNSQILNRRVVDNQLKQITIQENVTEYSGQFSEKQVTQERVLYIGGGALFRDNELVDMWDTNLTYIPLVPVYTNQVGFMDAVPRYVDLAELNLKHFNFQSQLDKTLFIASNPIPVIWGTLEKDNDINVGVDQALHFQHKDEGGFKWEEFTGTSVDKLQDEIGKTEARMLSIGLATFTEKEQTAFEAKLSSTGETSDLSSMSSALSKGLMTAYGYWCDMMKKTAKGTITANKDFIGNTLTAQEAKFYLDMYNAGTLTLNQFWDEMENREYITKIEDRDVIKAELEANNQNTDLEG